MYSSPNLSVAMQLKLIYTFTEFTWTSVRKVDASTASILPCGILYTVGLIAAFNNINM